MVQCSAAFKSLLPKVRSAVCPGGRGRCLGTAAAGRSKDESRNLPEAMPCQKPTDLIVKKTAFPTKRICEKVCMPCCPPARSPPECYYPYKKPPCKKIKPPRPAYSECKLDAVPQVLPCECDIPRAPPCDTKSGSKKKC